MHLQCTVKCLCKTVQPVCTNYNYVKSAYCSLHLLLCPQMVLFTLGHVVIVWGELFLSETIIYLFFEIKLFKSEKL